MHQTPKFTFALHGCSLLSALLIISFALLSQTGAAGIYTYKLVGIFYEILWLPSLVALVGIPLVWLVLTLQKKATWTALLFPVALLVGLVLYLTLFQ
ncbi:hypothetical protein [Myroides sp. DW712]|uniref:hypothetical protein n=1 Tax=Myroides sp. DW712 TaxID=3389800 RepID=UPI00397CA2A8